MTAIKTTLAARTADPQVKPLGALDESGAGAGPFHMTKALVDSSGAIIDPAKDATLAAVNGTLNAALGAPGDAAWNAGAGSLVALLKAVVGAFAKVDALHSDNGAGAASIAQPAGGSGLAGWLSGIYGKLSGALTVQWSGQSVAATQSGAWGVTTTEGASSIATNQVSIAASATQIVAARAGRKAVLILNEGTIEVRLGGAGVTTATGLLLYGARGAGVAIDGGAAVYGIVVSGTQNVSYVETW